MLNSIDVGQNIFSIPALRTALHFHCTIRAILFPECDKTKVNKRGFFRIKNARKLKQLIAL
jgi:hypothetical protein